MNSSKQNLSGGLAIADKTHGNPEGKGSNGLLLDWAQSRPRGLIAKPRRQLLADFFTSMLVLSATFKYRPVVGIANYLYWNDDEWSLSLISPDEWSAEKRAACAGTCVLQQDMTWTILPSELLHEESPVAAAVARFYRAFAQMLDTDLTLEEILPFYAGRLPYYQRLYASAMSRSLEASVTIADQYGDQRATSCRSWRRLLPQARTPAIAADRLLQT
jgi:hypothetical protein